MRSLPIDLSLENKHSKLKLGYFLQKFPSKGPWNKFRRSKVKKVEPFDRRLWPWHTLRLQNKHIFAVQGDGIKTLEFSSSNCFTLRIHELGEPALWELHFGVTAPKKTALLTPHPETGALGNKHWGTCTNKHREKHLDPFVRIDLADCKLPGNNPSITSWVFSVSSYILVLR